MCRDTAEAWCLAVRAGRASGSTVCGRRRLSGHCSRHWPCPRSHTEPWERPASCWVIHRGLTKWGHRLKGVSASSSSERPCSGSWRRTSWTWTPRWRSCRCSRRRRIRTTTCACTPRRPPRPPCPRALREGQPPSGRLELRPHQPAVPSASLLGGHDSLSGFCRSEKPESFPSGGGGGGREHRKGGSVAHGRQGASWSATGSCSPVRGPSWYSLGPTEHLGAFSN